MLKYAINVLLLFTNRCESGQVTINSSSIVEEIILIGFFFFLARKRLELNGFLKNNNNNKFHVFHVTITIVSLVINRLFNRLVGII